MSRSRRRRLPPYAAPHTPLTHPHHLGPEPPKRAKKRPLRGQSPRTGGRWLKGTPGNPWRPKEHRCVSRPSFPPAAHLRAGGSSGRFGRSGEGRGGRKEGRRQELGDDGGRNALQATTRPGDASVLKWSPGVPWGPFKASGLRPWAPSAEGFLFVPLRSVCVLVVRVG